MHRSDPFSLCLCVSVIKEHADLGARGTLNHKGLMGIREPCKTVGFEEIVTQTALKMPTDPRYWEKIEFSATVPAEMRPAVEALFFFNPRQADSIKGISATVERAGTPAVMEHDGRLSDWCPRRKHAVSVLF